MPYSLSFTETTDYLHVPFSGDFRSGDSEAMWSEISDYLSAHPHKRILVERQSGTFSSVSLAEMYGTAAFVASDLPFRNIRVSILLSEGGSEKTLSLIEFWETVAINRGGNVHIHYSREEAMQWLRPE